METLPLAYSFGPALGQYVAQLVLENQQPKARFELSRFQRPT
jgi:hypothetical protein